MSSVVSIENNIDQAGSFGANRLADLRAADAAHHLHPFSDMKEVNRIGTRIIAGGEGVYIRDAEGRRILDGFSGLWNVNVGYGRREIADAVHRQMTGLPYYNLFFKATNVPATELAAMLNELTPHQFTHAFFTNSGSESNDTIIRMVRHYWRVLGKPTKTKFIARRNAYHGSTVAATSLGGMKYMHEQDGSLIPDVHHVAQPYWWAEGGDMTPEAFGEWAANEVAREIDRHGAENVAAFIGEPIQGSGGVIIPPETYWPAVQRICRERDVLLISDEVICGFGRTGRWFGCEYFGFEPDFMTMAKGISSGYLPLGGVMVSGRVAEVIGTEGGEFNHGFTTSGHPVACAAALANLSIIRGEKLVERIADDIGPYLGSQWKALADHPLVGEARIVGLIGALELTPDKKTRGKFAKTGTAGNLCRDIAYQAGLVLRATGDTLLIAPPFILSRTEADELITLTRQSLDEGYAKLKSQGLV